MTSAVFISDSKSGFTLESEHMIIKNHWVESLPHDRLILIEKITCIYLTWVMEYHPFDEMSLEQIPVYVPVLMIRADSRECNL